MQSTSDGPLILGGSSHVGRALRAVWPRDAAATWQSRHNGPFQWDILNAPAPNLPEGITGIIALAGVTQGDRLADNTALAQAACALAARENLPVLLASSQAVYGHKSAAARETDLCQPTTPYGQAKLAMEQAVSDAPRATLLRISNVVGCDALLLNAARGRQIKLDRFPNGESPRRAYISPVVLGQVLRRLLAKDAPLPRILNVTQAGSVGMADLLRAADIPWDWIPAGPSALAALELDSTQLASLVDVPPATPSQLIADARAAGWSPT